MPIISVVFILLFLFGLGAALLSSGVWAFYLYQLIYFFNPGDRWWSTSIPSISYSFIAVVVMILACLFRYKDESEPADWSAQPISKWIVLILVMYVFMHWHAINLAVHKQSTIEFVKLIVVLMTAYKLITSSEKLKKAIWGYILGCTYIGYVAFNVGRNSGNRVEGIGTVDAPDSNGIAAAIAPSLVFLIYYAWMGNKYYKAMAVIGAGFVVNAIVLINSRGAFLAAAVGGGYFIAYMIFSKFQRKNQRAMALFIILSGALGALSLTDDAFWERMNTLKEVDDGSKSGSHRVEFWMVTFDIMEDYPLGVGVKGYHAVSARYMSPELTAGGVRRRAVHSTWFQSLAELGWPGPVLYIALLMSCYRLSLKTRQHLQQRNKIDEYFFMIALEGALIGFVVAATFISRFRAEILYWLILFIACAGNIYYLKYIQDEKDSNKLQKGK